MVNTIMVQQETLEVLEEVEVVLFKVQQVVEVLAHLVKVMMVVQLQQHHEMQVVVVEVQHKSVKLLELMEHIMQEMVVMDYNLQ